MRIAVIAAALFAPSLALAQTTAAPSEADKTWSELQEQAAEAESAQDCAIACRALQSLARATQHLCDLGPEHCEQARAKLREATARVRAMCPGCEIGAGGNEPPRTERSPAPAGDQLVAASATEKKSGCAGCSTTPPTSDLIAPALAALAFWITRRGTGKKKQRRL